MGNIPKFPGAIKDLPDTALPYVALSGLRASELCNIRTENIGVIAIAYSALSGLRISELCNVRLENMCGIALKLL